MSSRADSRVARVRIPSPFPPPHWELGWLPSHRYRGAYTARTRLPLRTTTTVLRGRKQEVLRLQRAPSASVEPSSAALASGAATRWRAAGRIAGRAHASGTAARRREGFPPFPNSVRAVDAVAELARIRAAVGADEAFGKVAAVLAFGADQICWTLGYRSSTALPCCRTCAGRPRVLRSGARGRLTPSIPLTSHSHRIIHHRPRVIATRSSEARHRHHQGPSEA
jgi:hypothetical protein